MAKNSPDIKSAMGLGGSSGRLARQFADLREDVNKLNTALKETERLSKSISKNLAGASGKSGGKTAPGDMGGMEMPATGPVKDTTSLGFQGPGADKLKVGSPLGFVEQSKSGMGAAAWDSFKANIGQLGLGLLAGATQMVDAEGMVMNDIVRRRTGFFAGQYGSQFGSNAMRSLMSQGTFMNKMDAAGAISAGTSMGLMPGMANYGTVLGSMAAISNLTPGVTGEQTAGAVGALNQASSVNKLRMIGVNVRDSNGMMRGFTDIARQLWSILNRDKMGSEKLTAQDLSFSLQSGNSLDSLLNQYFGNDPVLRQAVVTELFKLAGGGTGTRSSQKAMGYNPDITQSQGLRSAGEYNALDTYTSPGVQGIVNSNKQIADAANALANLTGPAKELANGFTELTTYISNLASAGNGGLGTILGSVANFAGSLFGGMMAARALTAAAGATSAVTAGSTTATALTAGANTLGMTAVAAAPLAMAVGITEGTKADFAAHGVDITAYSKANYPGGILPKGPGAKNRPGYGKSWEELAKMYPLGGGGNGSGTGGEGVGDVSKTASPLDHALSTPNNGEFWNKASFRRQNHRGVDFRAKTGDKVFAVKDGTIVKAGEEGDLGNMLRIKHADGSKSVYGHLSGWEKRSGDVKAGELIGFAGWSGGVYPKGPEGAHLHLAWEKSGSNEVMNPAGLLAGAVPSADTSSGEPSTPKASSNSLFSSSAGSLFSGAGGEGVGDSSGATYYGGVTVHINVPKGTSMNEEKLAREIKRVLASEEQLRMAVNR